MYSCRYSTATNRDRHTFPHTYYYGSLLQGSWKIAVLQVVLIIIIALFWYPFVKIADKMELQAEKIM